MEQIYTEDNIKIDAINEMMLELKDVPVTQRAKRKQLKFLNQNAKESFKFSEKWLRDLKDDEDAESCESVSLSDEIGT